MAYELVQDFQYTNDKKQILTLKKGTKLETEVDGFYIFKVQGRTMSLERDLVINNPDFFKKIDWVVDLAEVLKKNRKATSPKLAKIIGEYVQTNVLEGHEMVPHELMEIMMEACRIQYYDTKDENYLRPIKKMGWAYNEKGVYPPHQA